MGRLAVGRTEGRTDRQARCTGQRLEALRQARPRRQGREMSVDPALAKAHLRVTSASEDLLIAQYLDAATSWVERFTGQKLSGPETVTDSFTAFGDFLQL